MFACALRRYCSSTLLSALGEILGIALQFTQSKCSLRCCDSSEVRVTSLSERRSLVNRVWTAQSLARYVVASVCCRSKKSKGNFQL